MSITVQPRQQASYHGSAHAFWCIACRAKLCSPSVREALHDRRFFQLNGIINAVKKDQSEIGEFARPRIRVVPFLNQFASLAVGYFTEVRGFDDRFDEGVPFGVVRCWAGHPRISHVALFDSISCSALALLCCFRVSPSPRPPFVTSTKARFAIRAAPKWPGA